MNAPTHHATSLPEDHLDGLYEWGLERLDEVFRSGQPLGIEIYFLRTRDGADQLTLSPVDVPSLQLPEDVDVGDLLPMQFLRNFPDYDCTLTLRSVWKVMRERPLNQPMPWVDAGRQADREEFCEVKVGTRRALAIAHCSIHVACDRWWMERVPLKRIEYLANDAGRAIPVADYFP